MQRVRVGVIGVGGMGRHHCGVLKDLKSVEFTAVCDVNADTAKVRAEECGCEAFSDYQALHRSGKVDAVIIAVPHFFHAPIAIDAMANGIHVLVEKPISVDVADARRMIAAHQGTGLQFAAMFQMRSNRLFREIKRIIDAGELGRLTRAHWIISSWYRTQAYYDGGSWRATWKGEGGGVLVNQCPHQLDIFQWLVGMPSKVRAFCHLGKHHDIEVEDEVTAYLEYPNGATGLFYTTTFESPGSDRLEIVGEGGRLICTNGELQFTRNDVSMLDYIQQATAGFARPQTTELQIKVPDAGGRHVEIIENFVDAILGKAELIAPAPEGIHSVELANAMLYSSFTEQMVELPLDAEAYAAKLAELQAQSRFSG